MPELETEFVQTDETVPEPAQPKRTLFIAGEQLEECDRFIAENVDQDGVILCDPEEYSKKLEEYFGAEEVAHGKLNSLENMKLERLRNIRYIDAEMSEIKETIDSMTEDLRTRLLELETRKDSNKAHIERYTGLVFDYMKIRGIRKFDIGTTRAHLTPHTSVFVPAGADLSGWDASFVSTKLSADKKALKAALESEQEVPEGVRLEVRDSITWK